MKLSEKILYCRKKEGLSQEGLAERLGISRQAISKWETGDAVPEISKLLLLANTFHVSIDWLLTEDEPETENTSCSYSNPAPTPDKSESSWVDSLPGMIGRLIRSFGWLFGVYLTLIGTGLTGLGFLIRYIVRQMFGNMFSNVFDNTLFNSIDPFITDSYYSNNAATTIINGGQSIKNFVTNNPVYTLGMILIVIGVIIMIIGIILTIMLRKLRNEKQS